MPGGCLVEARRLFELRDRILVMLLGQLELRFYTFDGNVVRRVALAGRRGRRRIRRRRVWRAVLIHQQPDPDTDREQKGGGNGEHREARCASGCGRRWRLHPPFLAKTAGDLHPHAIGGLHRVERIRSRADRLHVVEERSTLRAVRHMTFELGAANRAERPVDQLVYGFAIVAMHAIAPLTRTRSGAAQERSQP